MAPVAAKLLVAAAVALAAGGCGPASGASPSPATTPAATPAPSAAAPTSGPVFVTFRVADTETFRVELVEPDDIAIAYALLAGEAAPAIPNGRLVRGPNDVNVGHPWTLDPADIEFADITTEVCDGLPSMVDDPSFTSDRYCPWAAAVVAVEPAPGG